jgi:hypothetical protein
VAIGTTTAGTAKLAVMGGNVGIGTTTPRAKLEVNASSGDEFTVYDGFYNYNIGDTAKALGSNYWSIYKNSSDTYYNSTVGGHLFLVSGVEKMRVDRTGNVGIGTTNPLQKLDVTGTAGNNATLLVIKTTGVWSSGQGTGIQFRDSAGEVGHIQVSYDGTMTNMNVGGFYNAGYGASATQVFTIKGNGSVGVGTITPATKFHIYDTSSGPIITLSGLNNNYRGLTIKNTSSAEQWFVGNNASNNFVIRATGSNDILTVSSSTGNVGIGTTTPSTALHIYPHTNTEGLRIVSSNYSPLVIRDSTDWNDLFRVNQSGDVTAVTSSATRMRSNNYCDADGANCFDPSGGWGSVSYFATVTSSTYNGNNNGHPGYAYAHARCKDQLAGSHVCSAEEILNTIRENKTMPTVGVWIFNGPPGYEAVANDCAARTIDSAGTSGDYKYGSYWQAPSDSYPQGKGLLMKCNVSLKLACCL